MVVVVVKGLPKVENDASSRQRVSPCLKDQLKFVALWHHANQSQARQEVACRFRAGEQTRAGVLMPKNARSAHGNTFCEIGQSRHVLKESQHIMDLVVLERTAKTWAQLALALLLEDIGLRNENVKGEKKA